MFKIQLGRGRLLLLPLHPANLPVRRTLSHPSLPQQNPQAERRPHRINRDHPDDRGLRPHGHRNERLARAGRRLAEGLDHVPVGSLSAELHNHCCNQVISH